MRLKVCDSRTSRLAVQILVLKEEVLIITKKSKQFGIDIYLEAKLYKIRKFQILFSQ